MHPHYDMHQSPKYLHAVDHCMKQAELVLRAAHLLTLPTNADTRAHTHAHCVTHVQRHSQEVPSL